MDERQAPIWIYGSGTLALRVGTPEPTRVGLWVDSSRRPDVEVMEERTLVARLRGRRWHSVVLEVPTLMGTTPPRGLTLFELSLR
jgi:hypothetical protein